MMITDPTTDVLYVLVREKDPEAKGDREILFTFPMDYSHNTPQS